MPIEIDWDKFRAGTIIQLGIAGPYIIMDMGYSEQGQYDLPARPTTPLRFSLVRANIELALLPAPDKNARAAWTLPADPSKIFHFDGRAYTIRGFSGPPGSGGTVTVDLVRVPQLDGSDADGNVPELLRAVRRFRQPTEE